MPSKQSKKLLELKFDDSDVDKEIEDEKDEKEIDVETIEYKTKELEFKKLSLHDQILLRPDSFLGSTIKPKIPIKEWIKARNNEDDHIFVQKPVSYPDGLRRMTMEGLSNVIDNIWRSKQYKIPAKIMKFYLDKNTGWHKIWNDGKPIPLDLFENSEDYIPEVLFGQLLSSSNYDDSEHRKTSGRNGVGATCINIFSDEFLLEIYNPAFKAIYKQSWKNNMYDKTKPEFITDKKQFPINEGKTGYTMISWKPDFKRFGMTGIEDDYLSVIEKTIYDYALIAKMTGDVKTFYNDQLIIIDDLKSYAELYIGNKNNSISDQEEDSDDENSSPKVKEIIQLKSKDCTAVLIPRVGSSKEDLMHISFMNGILTKEGGAHVDAWAEAIFRPIVNKINKVDTEKKKEEKGVKKKKQAERPKIDISHVKKYFTLFLVAECDNPVFKGQEKEKFVGKKIDSEKGQYDCPGISVNVKKSDISKLMKWRFVQNIEDGIRLRELASLKDLGKKKRNYTRIKNLDDANNAGDKRLSQECILCCTEGASATTYVVNGLKYGIDGKKGRDMIGTISLKGKLLNIRNASTKTIAKNEEVISLIKALGLEIGLDYTLLENRKKLRYGQLYVFADSDKDGLHVTGLIYNFFDTLFPSLLKADNFFHFMRTPIVKISTKEHKLLFLFYDESKKYIIENNIKKGIRYFKGLGTSLKSDIKEDFGKYPVSLFHDEDGPELMNKIFYKKEADFRKEWLLQYYPKIKTRLVPAYEMEKITTSEFLNEEMILFSLDDCRRSIPSVLDGLKESQRKVLYAAFKRKLYFHKKTVKVAQFAGYVSEHTGYHHGEQNLYSTITRMGQRFPGSNNIPLFNDAGQFGSRLMMGNDAANARYIFTKLEQLTTLIFRQEDNIYLPDIEDEGQIVEKEYYMPIVPMILINGGSGIGTGSSSKVPMYNILEIIEWIKIWIDRKGQISESNNKITFYETPDLVPYWRHFKGKVEVDGSKITTYGIIDKIKDNEYKITELPIGRMCRGINKYKEKVLEKLLENKNLKKVKNYSGDNSVEFVIYTEPDGIVPTLTNMKLTDTLSTSNMVLFDIENRLRKFKSVEEILIYFCEKRYEWYNIRRNGDIKDVQEQLKWVNNKIRYIEMVDKGELITSKRDESELEQEMDKKKFDRKPKKKAKKTEEKNENIEEDIEEEKDSDNNSDSEDQEEIKTGSFDYLRDMKHRTLNIKSPAFKKLIKERETLSTKLSNLETKSAEQIWLEELEELKLAYIKWDRATDLEGDGPKKISIKKPKHKA
jgi:DNA topoisomerase-2